MSMSPDEARQLLASVTVVVAAAGKGVRFGGDVAKQYLDVDGRTVLEHSLSRLEALSPKQIILVVAPDDDRYTSIDVAMRCHIVTGGASRADSVLNALNAVDLPDDDWVMVHDAARPCFQEGDVLNLVIRADRNEAGGLLATRVVETVKQADEYQQVVSTENRDALWLAQTPQLFRYGLLRRAMVDAIDSGVSVTDESSALEYAGYRPVLVEGARSNIKVTRPQDLELARWLLSREGAS